MAGSTAFNQGWLSSNRGPATLDTLPPIARVITVAYGDNAVAYPYEVMAVEQVVNDFVGGKKLVIFCAAGTASALDAAQFTAGRDVGAATAYDLTLGDQILTFYSMGGRFLDHQTGSVLNTLGQAVAGLAVKYFWFTWVPFMPQTRIYSGAAPQPALPGTTD